jgi:hypothetical protein
VIKETLKGKKTRDWSSLTDLRPTHGVVPFHWLVGVTSLRKNGYPFFSKSWS